MNSQIDKIIRNAITEDIPTIDVTTDNLFTNQTSCFAGRREVTVPHL